MGGRLPPLALLLAGCTFTLEPLDPLGGSGDAAVADLVAPPGSDLAGDLALPPQADLAVPADMAVADDMAAPADMTVPPDMTTPPDLYRRTLSFGGGVSFVTNGLAPFAVIARDLSGDGNPDVATVNSASNTAAVLLGDGAGMLGGIKTYNVDAQPHGITAADISGDGKIDLAVSNGMGNDVTVLTGDGKGMFAVKGNYPAGNINFGRLATGDFNEDGKLDVVVGNYNDNTLGFLKGGAGGALGMQNAVAGGMGPVGVAVDDLDGDNHLDVVSANNAPMSTQVTVMTGDGKGNFVVANLTVAALPYMPALVDLNHDSKLDIVVSHNGAMGGVSSLLGKGDGTFQAPTYLATANGSRELAVADYDLDGEWDVATADRDANSITVLLGKGDGTFALGTTIPAPGNPRGVAAADFNKDGRPDLVSANDTSNTVTIFLNMSQ